MKYCSVITILTAMILATNVQGSKAFLLNGTAVTVAKKLITVQDAYFYRALMRLRAGEKRPLLAEDLPALQKTVQKMAFEEMVFREMKSFQFDGGSRSDAEKLVAKRTGGKTGAKHWKDILSRFKRSEEEAIDWIFKSLQVEKFLQRKVDTLTPIITLREVEHYYNQNKEKYKGNTLEAVRPSVEVLLKKERMRKALEEWIRFLRDKYGVTNHLAG